MRPQRYQLSLCTFSPTDRETNKTNVENQIFSNRNLFLLVSLVSLVFVGLCWRFEKVNKHARITSIRPIRARTGAFAHKAMPLRHFASTFYLCIDQVYQEIWLWFADSGKQILLLEVSDQSGKYYNWKYQICQVNITSGSVRSVR